MERRAELAVKLRGSIGSGTGVHLLFEVAREVVDVALGLILGEAVVLLDAAGEFLALAIDGAQIVVGQLAPFLLDPAAELPPVTLDLVPIHVNTILSHDSVRLS